MSRLIDIKVDEKQWKVVKIDNGKDNYDSYKLIDKKNEEIYFFKYIIGLEQVKEDEFLIFRRENYDYFEIVRYKLQESKFTKIFSKSFSQFHFISDDRIMFTNWGKTGPYTCTGIYSIKENSMLEETKWLDGAAIDIYNDDSGKNILYVEETLYSTKLGNPKLLFTVDPETLQPNSECYSQLRDKFIKVNNKEDINNIELEEKKYIRIIEDYMFQQEREQIKQAKEKVLTIK